MQIKVEYGQQHEMATAFGVRALGTALVVISGSYRFPGQAAQWVSFPSLPKYRRDYQSGPERPHSKGSADLIYAYTSIRITNKEVI